MMAINLTNRKITIIGAKRSGWAAARLVLRLQGYPRFSEQGSLEALPADFKQWVADHHIPLECQGHSQAFIAEGDLLVLSPGVRIDSLPVAWARGNRIPVLGEIEFAAQFCPLPIIAVTGSNGKTTVSTLIKEILEAAGKRVCLCGNIGATFSGHVLDLQGKDFVVLEVSSFQLESLIDSKTKEYGDYAYRGFEEIRGFKPFIAVVLNVSQNHLDRHKDMEEYFAAKKKIFSNQDLKDFAVLNYQDPLLRDLSSRIKATAAYFAAPGQVSSQGVSNPNHLAVLEVARVLNIPLKICQQVFREFKGVEHRLEWVRCINGVDYLNDSKSTTTEATRWAIRYVHKPMILICGGRDKHIDFSVLTQELKEGNVKKILVIGEAREKIRRAFENVVDIEESQSLKEAVLRAQELAVEGDCVVLSPMCTSFDMFTDFEHRGRIFKEVVCELEDTRTQVTRTHVRI